MFSKSLIAIAAISGVTSALPQYSGSSGYSSGSYGSSGNSNSNGYSGSSGYSNSNGYSGSSGYGNSNSYSGSSGYSGSSDSVDSIDASSSIYYSSSSSIDYNTYTAANTYTAENTYITSSVYSTSTEDDTSVLTYSSSTFIDDSTSTSTALATYSTPSYGSGSTMSWDSSGYDGCVQQCIAQYGSPGTYTPPTSTSDSTDSYTGSSGTGSTITVIVAPTQGVLRYYPFAVNASVGDTVKFMWGANNHTVTKSSELTPCNKTSEAPFASGEQNESFVFTQVVNDTSPTFFYCGTPTHCEQGMFGIINPPSAFNAPTSVSGMMSSVVANDSTGNLATYAAYTANATSGSAGANWGSDIDMSSMPSWSYDLVMENVMFTRNVLAMNPDQLNADGSINLSSVGTTPMMVPPDVGSALAAASTSSSSTSGAAAVSSAASSAASSTGTSAPSSNGAASVASSKVLVAATVLVATFFAL